MNTFLANSIAGSLLCFTALAFAENTPTTTDSEDCPSGSKHYRASVRHIEGGGIGYDDGYTTLEGFFAPDPQKLAVMPFLDVRGHVFDSGKMAANAGLGFRGILGCRTYGLNAYYDYRNTKRRHYNQIGLGLETLGTLWDIRLNGYLPIGKKISSPYDSEFGAFFGNSLLVSQKHQFAMKGADAEMGFHFGKTRLFDFYAAAGPYYYIGEIGGNTWGGKGRIAGMFKEYITLEISNSYDRMFDNNFQCQLTFSLPFGGKSKVKRRCDTSSCKKSQTLVTRMVQQVGREEIIVVGKARRNVVATNPLTGAPLVFVFVDNTSKSNGSYESPYHTLAQAEASSKPGDIIYVFPGDGTTTGMASGITLQADQKFWGSGTSHVTLTSQGAITIPAQTTTAPLITNTDINTSGDAITLATNNAISGFTITSARRDATYGVDPQSLEVSFCTIENTTTFAIQASFSGDASVVITNNQFLNNANGVNLTLNGTSTLDISDNTFKNQSSISNAPIEIISNNNVLTAHIENNVIDSNIKGSIYAGITSVLNANFIVVNNTITNNGTGAAGAQFGSSFVINPLGSTSNCSIALENNTFSQNGSSALVIDGSGVISNLDITASSNIMSNNGTLSNGGGSGIVLASPVDVLTLQANNNTITNNYENGIAVINNSAVTTTGNITISNNTIKDIFTNGSNGIAVNQDFSTLTLTILNNTIDNCDGSGVVSYAPTGITSFTFNASGNTITNCQNSASNLGGGIAIDQFSTLYATIENNTLLNNVTSALHIGTTLSSDSVCLKLTGNNSDNAYDLSNGASGTFNLTPCDAATVNTGSINPSGTITYITSCPGGSACPP